MRYFLILLMGLLPMLACAVEFDDTTRTLPLGRAMQVLEDAGGMATIEEVASPASNAMFKANGADVLNAGYSKSAFWLKVDLHYSPRLSSAYPPRNWLLELGYPPMDQVELYLPDANGVYSLAQRTGDTLPWSSRQVKQNNFLFNVPFSPNESKTLYLRVQSEGSVQVPLSLWAPSAYIEAQPERFYVFGIIYGVLLVMLVYNLFIYISVRDVSYLYYILYIASFGLYQVSVNGAGVQFLWPESPWWANAATPFLIGAAALFGCQFARNFLRTATHSRWVDRLLCLMMAWGVLVMGLAVTAGYGLSLRLATALALAFTVVVFSAGLTAWLRGLRQARYFLIAWSAFLLGGIVNTLMVLGVLPNGFLTMYSSQFGSAIEVALLSLALADRINVMREEQARTLKDTGQKLEALNQQLSASNRLKDEFLATLTHELRTPMNGVIGSLELMQTVPMGVELSEYQQTAAGSARDMMRMVDDILMLTELQAGRLYPRQEPFRLRALLDSLEMQFAGQAQDKGLAFKVEADPALPQQLRGDSKHLALCLSCLLSNAIKFTRQGSVTLAVRMVSFKSPVLSVNFEVRDTGIGFKHLEDDTLYQRFFQVDGSMTREYGGLGIGLAICRQLTELMGGELRHESELGRGSRFELELRTPAIEPYLAEACTRPSCTLVDLQAHNHCVLMVGESSVDQLVTRGMLLKLGYQVRTADTLQTAVDAMHHERIDALLLDCEARPAQAFEWCRQLREGGASLPILAVLGSHQRGEGDRAQAQGVSECLPRPLHFDQVQGVLQRQLLARASENVES